MIMNWQTDETPHGGLTLNQWVVREAIRLQKWADYYWDAIDGGNELSVTQRLIQEYNEVCDQLDRLETNPLELFLSSET